MSALLASDCSKNLGLLCGSFIFIHGVSLLRIPINGFPMLEWNDMLDLFGIFLLISSYWVIVYAALKASIFKIINETTKTSEKENKNDQNNKSIPDILANEVSKFLMPFIFSVILICIGWGTHNAANANGHLFSFSEKQAVKEWDNMIEQSDWFYQQTIPTQFTISNFTFPLYSVPKFCNWTLIKSYYLTYFYDEQLGHILAHSGWCILDSIVLWFYWNLEIIFKAKKLNNYMIQNFVTIAILGFISGLLFFARSIEGQTAKWIGIPWSLCICIIILNKFFNSPVHILKKPVVTFIFVQCITGLWLMLCWGLYFGSFIEFSTLGWL